MARDPFRPNPWLTVGKLFGTLLVTGVIAAGIAFPYVGGLGFVADKVGTKFLDTTCTLQETRPPQKTTLFARDGKTEIATLFTQDRVPIPLTKMAPYVTDALIATEDRRFYQHHGVDMRGLLRSAVSTSSGDTQGGSTLTMQYVKQMRYYQASEIQDPKKRQAAQLAAIDVNLKRKMEDAKCALYYENVVHESKAQILDNYLNIAFFGENSYGIEVAAETYFHKHASDLSLGESALLIGLLRAPSSYDPFVYRQNALERRNQVLQNLVAVGKLSQAKADEEKATPIALATSSPPPTHEGCSSSATLVNNAAFFCEYVTDWLDKVNGISQTTLQTGGLKIVTTLDPNLQNAMQKKIDARVPATSPMTATMPAVDPKTGDVLAMAASKRWGPGKGQTEQPIFTEYTAPGASTFKLFPLLTALSTGVPDDWKLKTVGSQGTYTSKSCPGAAPVPNGDANVSYNDVETLASATAKSSNTYYIGLTDALLKCNLQPIVDIMEKLGMQSLQQHHPTDNPKLTYAQNLVASQRGQQLVLGSVPTSPLELAGAYAAVADNGVFHAPAPVLSITDSDGNALPVKRSPAIRAVAAQVAAQAVKILTGDTQPGGTAFDVFDQWDTNGGSEIAGKTGTAQADPQKTKNSAVWFVGMTPNLVAATGVINFDSPSAPSTGLKHQGRGTAYGDFAAQVWWDALKPALHGDSWSWTQPGQVAGEDVPDIKGMTYSDAKAALAEKGLKIRNLDAADNLQCDSDQSVPDTVGYYGPQIAKAGSVITVCLASGVPQYVPPPPPPPPVHQPPPTRGHGTRNGSGSGSGGGTRPGPGHGGGGHGGGH